VDRAQPGLAAGAVARYVKTDALFSTMVDADSALAVTVSSRQVPEDGCQPAYQCREVFMWQIKTDQLDLRPE